VGVRIDLDAVENRRILHCLESNPSFQPTALSIPDSNNCNNNNNDPDKGVWDSNSRAFFSNLFTVTGSYYRGEQKLTATHSTGRFLYRHESITCVDVYI
jgi:hypothetical protein